MTPALQALLDDLTAERFGAVVKERHRDDVVAVPEPLAVVVPLVREAS